MGKRSSSSKKKPAKPSKPSLNIPVLITRIVLGIVLLVVVVLAVSELRARSNYNTSLTELLKEVKVDLIQFHRKDLKRALSGSPSQTVDEQGNRSVVRLRWGSLFKRYEITATFEGAGDEGRLLSVVTVDSAKE